MAAVVLASTFYKVSSVLRATKPSVAFSNPQFFSKYNIKENSHAWAILDYKTNSIKGCLTWLDDGFEFELKYTRNPKNKKLTPLLSITGHKKKSPKHKLMARDFFKSCLIKCDEIIQKEDEPFTGYYLNGLYIKRKTYGTPKKSKYLKNINYALANNLISKKAHKFLVKNKKYFMAAMHPSLP